MLTIVADECNDVMPQFQSRFDASEEDFGCATGGVGGIVNEYDLHGGEASW